MEAPPVVAPPVVANAQAQRTLDRKARDVRGPPYLRVARAAKRRKHAKNLNDAGMITEEELGQHDGFHLICTAVASGGVVAPGGAVIAGGGAPEWFGAGLQQLEARIGARMDNLEARIENSEARIGARIDNLEARIDNLEARIGARMDNLEARFDNIDARLNNIEARQRNSVARNSMDSLSEIQNVAGVAAPNFPVDVQALNDMDGGAMQAFLQFYELPVPGSLTLREQRIKAFIGMKP